MRLRAIRWPDAFIGASRRHLRLVRSFAHLHELHFDVDPHAVRDEHTAGLDRLIPAETTLPTIELGVTAEPRALLPPRVLAAALELAVENDLHRLVAHREVAERAKPVTVVAEVPFEPLTDERDLRIRLHVEEVGSPEMCVSIGHAGVEACRIDLDLDAAALWMILIARELRVHGFEASAHGGH